MSINNATPEMWDALRMEHPPIENNLLTNALKSYAAEAEKEEEDNTPIFSPTPVAQNS